MKATALCCALFIGSALAGSGCHSDPEPTMPWNNPSSPPTPTGVRASTHRCGEILVTWDAAEGDWKYEVSRASVNDFDEAEVIRTDVPPSNILDRAVTPRQQYFYWVRTIGGDGTMSDHSDPSARGRSERTPDAPRGLTASDGRVNEIILAWQAATGASTYTIEHRSCGATVAPWRVLKSGIVATTNPQFVYTPPACGVHDEFRVLAVNTCGTSGPSNVDCGWCADH